MLNRNVQAKKEIFIVQFFTLFFAKNYKYLGCEARVLLNKKIRRWRCHRSIYNIIAKLAFKLCYLSRRKSRSGVATDLYITKTKRALSSYLLRRKSVGGIATDPYIAYKTRFN